MICFKQKNVVHHLEIALFNSMIPVSYVNRLDHLLAEIASRFLNRKYLNRVQHFWVQAKGLATMRTIKLPGMRAVFYFLLCAIALAAVPTAHSQPVNPLANKD